MKVLFLHGLESKTNCAKVKWLRAQGHEVLNPAINYKDPEAFFAMKRLAKKNNIDVLVGSSMGGHFAFAIATSTNHDCVLLNPAVHSRAFEPENVNYGMCNPNIYCLLGVRDDVITPAETVNILNSEKRFTMLLGPHGHRTPVDQFERIINKYEYDKKIA